MTRSATAPQAQMGSMQLKPGTAKEMGVATRTTRSKTCVGGTRYLAQISRSISGNEARALAAYNRGPGASPRKGAIPEKMPELCRLCQEDAATGIRRPGDSHRTRHAATGPAPRHHRPTHRATGGTPQEQQALTRLDEGIATLRGKITQFARIGGRKAISGQIMPGRT